MKSSNDDDFLIYDLKHTHTIWTSYFLPLTATIKHLPHWVQLGYTWLANVQDFGRILLSMGHWYQIGWLVGRWLQPLGDWCTCMSADGCCLWTVTSWGCDFSSDCSVSSYGYLSSFYIMCVTVMPACMSAHHVCDLCLQRPEGVRAPRIGDADSYKLLCGY